jgi:endonuclease/exonuclease/phosphatase family metal-dependent hydrolase
VTELVVGTWNCFGMAQGAIDAITAWRAPYGERLLHDDIPRILAEAHVVCVQELMSRDAERLFARLGDVRVRDENGFCFRTGTMRGSGLGIAARGVSMKPSKLERFTAKQVGWDRLARKGTLHVRVTLDASHASHAPDAPHTGDPLEVDVLTAHLQSGYEPAASAVRLAQIGELAQRVAALGSADRPFVVCGDFNVCGLGGQGIEYVRLREALAGFEDLGAEGDLATFDPHPDSNSLAHDNDPEAPRQRIDYIFLRPARSRTCRVRKVTRLLDGPMPGAATPLSTRDGRPLPSTFASDHFGLAATLEVA